MAHAAITVNSIYQFGDSLSDTGNLIASGLGMQFDAGKLPYGETYFHEPTGRFSDGRLVIDYLATNYKLSFLEPYLNDGADFTQGVNFAVAGATALDEDFFTAKGITFKTFKQPISGQLKWFDEHLNSTCRQTADGCKKRIEESLFVFGEYGGNDYFTSIDNGKSLEEVKTYVPSVVGAITAGVREIIKVGAKQILVPGPYPFGCLPAQLTASAGSDPASYDDQGCLIDYNNLANSHYDLLNGQTSTINSEFSSEGVKVVLGDQRAGFLRVLKNPENFGMDTENLLKACCGTGGDYNYDPNRLCGSDGVNGCPNPEKALQWDGVHLTDKTYGSVAVYLITNDIPKLG
ncbi:PREDICTED: acetylajmalan esterase-like [Ipomoea nil]|uniref:acetylajmalan esterase-like n=1 Tax=Ipomoea nil TaxID=35883 RepID=UPI000900C860|nr:PREDICTED: acetylajmalan esterase-like [Ipomoea nil]